MNKSKKYAEGITYEDIKEKWGLKIAVLPEQVSGVPLSRVLEDAGIPPHLIITAECLSEIDFSAIDVLILPQDFLFYPAIFNGKKIADIRKFVEKGGICWIMHQILEGGDFSWLPKRLTKNLSLEVRYIPTLILIRSSGGYEYLNYLCPWILDRDHPLWNNPWYIDESDFTDWKISVAGHIFQTTALSAIVRQSGWTPIAGYEDKKSKVGDGASLIMEAKHGQGLYFWTQILSPGFVWHRKNSRERNAWFKLIQNTLRYFHDFRTGRIVKIKSSIQPWSVNAGSPVNIIINFPEDPGFTRITSEIFLPSGAVEKGPETKGYGKAHCLRYTPLLPGEYRIRVTAHLSDGREGVVNILFKTTDDITKYRFTTHHHYENDWVSESLSNIYGHARLHKIDAIFLASGQFYQSDDKCQILTPRILKKIDSPGVRFFPGQEIHPHHPYGLDEGATDTSGDLRHHAVTLGCPTIIMKNWNYWDPSIIAKVHKEGGLIFVAHHQRGDKWWLRKYQKHFFDGVGIHEVEFNYWDSFLKKGVLLPGICTIDNGGQYGGGVNTLWLRKPLTMENILEAIICGRVTYHCSDPENMKSSDSFIFFEINHQLPGGTVYAVNRIYLHVIINSHLKFRSIVIVKDGNRGYKNIRINSHRVNTIFTDRIDKSSYYRIEAYTNPHPDLKRDRPNALTNPIFVKKIVGPDGAYFYQANEGKRIFNPSAGRFVPDDIRVRSVSFRNGRWVIHVFSPKSGALLCIGGVKFSSVILNGIKMAPYVNRNGEYTISLIGGNHTLEIVLKL